MPHYELRKLADHIQGETLCSKLASTAEAIFYTGKSCLRPALKLQQWGNAKDDVGNACQQLELLHDDILHHIGCAKWHLHCKRLQSQEMC